MVCDTQKTDQPSEWNSDVARRQASRGYVGEIGPYIFYCFQSKLNNPTAYTAEKYNSFIEGFQSLETTS
jgi:hypothetical protein